MNKNKEGKQRYVESKVPLMESFFLIRKRKDVKDPLRESFLLIITTKERTDPLRKSFFLVRNNGKSRILPLD